MSDDNIYAYGVVEPDDGGFELEVTGVGGEPRAATTVSHGPLAAIVTPTDDLEPEQTEEAVRRHDEVLQAVMQHGDGRTVVPMRFGMAFANARALKNVLRSGRRAFTKALRQVDGTAEVGVKVLAPEEGAPGVDVESDVAASLADASVAASEGDLFSDRLLLNRSYLVERDARDAFDAAIDEIRDAHPDLGVRYSGPWAPYSFVDIEIGARQH